MKKIMKFLKKFWLWLLLAGYLLFQMVASSAQSEPSDHMDISQIEAMITDKEVSQATFYDEQHLIEIQTANGPLKATYTADYDKVLANELKTANVPFKVSGNDTPVWARVALKLSPYVFWGLVVLGIGIAVNAAIKTAKSSVVGNTDFAAERPKERFTDVDGAEEAIEKLATLKDLLLHPKKYEGLTLERGVILEGPTGTGKTLLAKAFAGEASVPFFHLSGSNLTSMWAGGTTQRIEKFFEKVREEAKKDSGCVVFIDEIDGIASARKGDQGADRDRNSSVTQLLHQVTALFADYPLAILFSATNNYATLDPAIKRPGRFGLHIAMPNPDQRARVAILQRNSKSMQLSSSVDLQAVGKMTVGMSGASVASIPHSAAILARRQRGLDAEVMPHNIEQAAMEVAGGTLRWSTDVRSEDLRLSAVHEAGHAVLAQRSPHHQLIVVTTVPIAESGGSTWCPPVEEMTLNVDSLLWRMAVSMGGRESEIIEFGKSSSGPSHDIETATALARAAVCEWGIFDEFLSKINVRTWSDHPRAEAIDAKVQDLMTRARVLARVVLEEERAFRSAIISGLGESRILHSDELQSLAEKYLSTSLELTKT